MDAALRTSSMLAMATAALCLVFLTGLAQAEMCDLSGSVGEALSVPSLCDTKSHILIWTHNSSIIFYRERGRVSLGKDEDVSADGCLQLKSLRFSSAGVYQAQVQLPNKTVVKSWSGHLCVTEKTKRIPKPQLVYKCDFPTNSALLDCSVPLPQGLTFSWMQDRKALSNEKGKTLNVSLSRLTAGGIFSCSVSNKMGEEKAEATRVLCVPPRPPPAPLCFAPRSVVAVSAGAAATILLLLITVMALACSLRQTRRQLRDKGRVRMGSLQRLEAEPVDLEYETMHHPEEPSTQRLHPQVVYLNVSDNPSGQADDTPHCPAGAPSPVPKPRTKGQLKQSQ
ncbi:uncharacterized protein LOC128770359 [Synchiropus splendidus]|uniref:uncharacterized protein LOC128770359 n=1 Tax=Synchiropus splendidus TaxID=270530 RepID=UPI00237ED9E2|nr:uncharacterized protein LOC128770359 [Synchiropus splendidus]